jgi:hypothetical protein
MSDTAPNSIPAGSLHKRLVRARDRAEAELLKDLGFSSRGEAHQFLAEKRLETKKPSDTAQAAPRNAAQETAAAAAPPKRGESQAEWEERITAMQAELNQKLAEMQASFDEKLAETRKGYDEKLALADSWREEQETKRAQAEYDQGWANFEQGLIEQGVKQSRVRALRVQCEREVNDMDEETADKVGDAFFDEWVKKNVLDDPEAAAYYLEADRRPAAKPPETTTTTTQADRPPAGKPADAAPRKPANTGIPSADRKPPSKPPAEGEVDKNAALNMNPQEWKNFKSRLLQGGSEDARHTAALRSDADQ